MKEEIRCIDPNKGAMLAAYEMGLLTSQDRREFEQHVSLCPACQEQLYAMAPHMTTMQANPASPGETLGGGMSGMGSMGGMQSHAFGKAGLDQLEKELRREAERSRRRAAGEDRPGEGGLLPWLRDLGQHWWPDRGWKGSWTTWVPATVTVGLLLVTLLQQIPSGTGPNWSEYAVLEPLPYAHQEVRGATGSASAPKSASTSGPAEGDIGAGQASGALAQFADAAALYETGDYAEAAPLLAQAADLLAARPEGAGPAGEQARLLAGVSYLLAGGLTEARIHLGSALGADLPVIVDRARWYRAQLALLQGEPDRAREALSELAEHSPGYGERARALLDRLPAQE